MVFGIVALSHGGLRYNRIVGVVGSRVRVGAGVLRMFFGDVAHTTALYWLEGSSQISPSDMPLTGHGDIAWTPKKKKEVKKLTPVEYSDSPCGPSFTMLPSV